MRARETELVVTDFVDKMSFEAGGAGRSLDGAGCDKCSDRLEGRDGESHVDITQVVSRKEQQ